MMTPVKILMIDDDQDFVAATKTVLESAGHQVTTAANKNEGLEKIGAAAYDLIIMDVMMEKMSDGFDLSRALKKDEKYSHIPILVLTSIGQRTGFKFSGEAGDKHWLPVDGYAEKPLAPEALLARIDELVSGKKAQG